VSVVCVVEHVNGDPTELSLQALAFARGFAEGGPVHALSIGLEADGLAAHGVGALHVAEHDVFGAYAPAAIAQSAVELAARLAPNAVLAAGNEAGNEVIAHVAAKLGVPFAANCVDAAPGDPAVVTRVRWGGSLLEEARLHGRPQLLTVQPHALAAEPIPGAPEPARERFTPTLSTGSRRRREASPSPTRRSSSRRAAAPARPRASRRSKSWRRSWAQQSDAPVP
jgi:electron transfer flavoprotein alpha subunit